MGWIVHEQIRDGVTYFIVVDENRDIIATVDIEVEDYQREHIANAIAAIPETINLLKEITFRATFGPDDKALEDEAIALINRLSNDVHGRF